MNPRDRCPVCTSERTFVFLNRSSVPVHQNLVVKEQAAAVNIARGDLRFACCEECGFIFNSAFNPSGMSYDAAYDNTQMCSPFFENYIEATVQYLVEEKGVRDCCIVEVGCGKGFFLRKLVEAEGAGNIGYGFDPAYVGPEVDLDGRLRFERRFYQADCTDTFADVVVCRHVIEHVPEPLTLLRSIRQALSASPGARVFFETPCVEWILRNQVIWDFFYEHCSLFTANSLTTALEATGFRVESVQHVFGGQYLWLEAIVAEDVQVTKQPRGVPQLARQFTVSESVLRNTWHEKVQQLATKDKLAIWGAGAKGVTFANLIDPRRELIVCVVDLNPQKQGNYLPGTGHPIVDYHDLTNLGVTTTILMNPNYREENRVLLRQASLDVRLVE